MNASSISQLFEAQKKNFQQSPSSTAEQRIAKLKKLGLVVDRHLPEIEEALRGDMRRHPAETLLAEYQAVRSEIHFAVKRIRKWMRPKCASTPWILFGTKSSLHYEPKGVVLILAPWNYPLSLTLVPLIAAIAAGNRVILKPSEMAPRTASVVKKIVSETFGPEEVFVFEGDARVAQELLSLPFDHIFFTGSTKVGKIVMEAAAKNLASVTLELGGKSPVIIDETASLTDAVARTLWGKFLNAGQTCIAPDYLLIAKNRLQEFLEQAQKVLTQFYGANDQARMQSESFARIISEGHFKRIRSLIDESVRQGAQVVVGGKYQDSQKFIAPTLLKDVTAQMPIMKEEIFGPVLPIMTYESLDEACRFIRSQDKPLSLYLFSRSSKNINFILSQTSAGGTTINDTMLHFGNPFLPFGGVGPSGMGSYHGEFGFKAFSHERAVLRQGPLSALKILYPPYTSRVLKLMRWVTRFL